VAGAADAPSEVPDSGGKPVITKLSPVAGPLKGGTKVTVTGTGLLGTTKVKFGTSAAKIITTSSTKVVVTSPAGTGTVDVVVTTAKGSSATGAQTKFDYLKAPVVSLLSPKQGPEVGGTTISIAGEHFVHVRAVHFGSAKAVIQTRSGTRLTVTLPSHALTTKAADVTVTVTTAGGVSAKNAASKFKYKAGTTPTPPTPPTPTPPTPTPPTPTPPTPTPSCFSCFSCGSCGGCSCALPESTSSVRRARSKQAAARRKADALTDQRGVGLSPLSRSRSRGGSSKAVQPANKR
jgi:hypothetical protein